MTISSDMPTPNTASNHTIALALIISEHIIQYMKIALKIMYEQKLFDTYDAIKNVIFDKVFESTNNQIQEQAFRIIYNKVYDENYTRIYNEIVGNCK